jgi:hypothetical protein
MSSRKKPSTAKLPAKRKKADKGSDDDPYVKKADKGSDDDPYDEELVHHMVRPPTNNIIHFIQRNQAEVVLDVGRNITQREDPFTHELNRLSAALPDALVVYFANPIIQYRSVPQFKYGREGVEHSAIELILQHCYGIQPTGFLGVPIEEYPYDSTSPFYVVSVEVAPHADPIDEDKILHLFAVRRFVTRHGEPMWVVLDSLPPKNGFETFHPFSIPSEQMSSYLFGSKEHRRHVCTHLYRRFPYVGQIIILHYPSLTPDLFSRPRPDDFTDEVYYHLILREPAPNCSATTGSKATYDLEHIRVYPNI